MNRGFLLMEREEIRSYLDTLVPHFHVCSGPRPGGHFLQSEAWMVHEMLIDSVADRVTEVAHDHPN